MSRTQSRIAWLPLAMLALFAVVLLRTAWVSDDAYITLRTVDNFVHGFGLRWNVAERVQTFTHPLWLFLLAAAYAFTREAFLTTLAVSALVSIAALALLARRYRGYPVAGVAAIGVLLLSKAFVDYSTSGLENPLTHLLLVAFVMAVPQERAGPRDLGLLALIAGLLALNRVDTLLLVGPAMAVLHWRSRSWRAAGAVALGFLPFLAWTAFAVVYYGIPYPNTALAKLGSGVPAGELAGQGVAYLLNSLRADPVTLAAIAAGVGVAIWRRRALDLALLAGVLAYLAYVVRIGGDFMSGRFLTAPLVMGVLLLFSPRERAARPAQVATVLLLMLGLSRASETVLSGRDFGLALDRRVDVHGIADERRYYFSFSGLLNGHGWATQPVAVDRWHGLDLRRCRIPLTVAGAVGFLGYYAGPSVHVVDVHSLGDPLLSRLPVAERDPEYDRFRRDLELPPSPVGWRIGHFLRAVPPGYLESLGSGRNLVRDARIARLWDDVALVTRGGLLDGERCRAMVRLWRAPLPYVPHTDPPSFNWRALAVAQPDNLEWRFREANRRLSAGEAEIALPMLARLAADAPCLVRAQIAFAEALALAGRGDEALGVLDAAATLERQNPDVWEARSDLLSDMRRFPEAKAAVQQAISLGAHPLFAGIRLARNTARAGDLPAALAALDDLERRSRRSLEIDLARAEMLAEAGRKEEALTALEAARRRHPASQRIAGAFAALR